MPRKPVLITTKQIWTARADWYQWHYDARAFLIAQPTRTQDLYRAAASLLPEPAITIFGGLPHDWPPMQGFLLANLYGLDVNYMCPWYASDAGWETFQSLWADLPEPVDLHPFRAGTDLYTAGPDPVDNMALVHRRADLPPKPRDLSTFSPQDF